MGIDPCSNLGLMVVFSAACLAVGMIKVTWPVELWQAVPKNSVGALYRSVCVSART